MVTIALAALPVHTYPLGKHKRLPVMLPSGKRSRAAQAPFRGPVCACQQLAGQVRRSPPFATFCSQRPSLRERALKMVVRGRAVFDGGVGRSRVVRYAFVGQAPVPRRAPGPAIRRKLIPPAFRYRAADMAYHLALSSGTEADAPGLSCSALLSAQARGLRRHPRGLRPAA